MTKEQAQSLRGRTSIICGMGWAAFALTGLILLGWQCFASFKLGSWQGYSAADFLVPLGIDPAQLTWTVLRKVAIWLADLPISLWLIFAPLFVFTSVVFLVEEFIEKVRSATDGEAEFN